MPTIQNIRWKEASFSLYHTDLDDPSIQYTGHAFRLPAEIAADQRRFPAANEMRPL